MPSHNAQDDTPEANQGSLEKEMNNLTSTSGLASRELVIQLKQGANMLVYDFPTVSTKGNRNIVVLCGSTQKALHLFRYFNLHLTCLGFIVLTIGCDTHSDAELETMNVLNTSKEELEQLHYDKIALADYVFVLNTAVANGDYIGASTGREVAYARSLGKEIWWNLQHICREGCNCRVHGV